MEPFWNQVRNEVPVEGFKKETFNEAIMLHHKLNSVSVGRQPYEAFNELIELNSDLNKVVQDFIRQIRTVHRQVKESDSEEISYSIYKIVDINVRYYRKKKIDKKIEQGIKGDGPNRGGVKRTVATRLKDSQQTLLNTIRKSLAEANEEFEPIEGQDDEMVYLFTLASSFESNIRYFGQYARQENGQEVPIDFDQMVGGTNQDVEKQLDDLMSQKDQIENKLEEADSNLDEIE